MRSFASLSPMVRGSFLCWLILLLFALLFLLALSARGGQNLRHIMINAGFAAGTYALLRLLTGGEPSAAEIPAALVALLSLLLTVFTVLSFYRFFRQAGREISEKTLREAVDRLPAGLCCYEEGGLCRLVNERMEALCRELTGRSLRDGRAFWGLVKTTPVLTLPDGRTFSFSRETLSVDGLHLYEIIAAEITDEYAVAAALLEKETKLREVNLRLRRLNENIGELTTAQEILDAKTRLHDRWSRTLLLTRRYLSAPAAVEKRALLSAWEAQLSLLTGENAEAEDLDRVNELYEDVLADAAALGISVAITGALPRDGTRARITAQAMTAVFDNLLRHTGGTHVMIEAKETGDHTEVTFTNDGEVPAAPVRETGGLKNLRQRVTESGGDMTVGIKPTFFVRITWGE